MHPGHPRYLERELGAGGGSCPHATVPAAPRPCRLTISVAKTRLSRHDRNEAVRVITFTLHEIGLIWKCVEGF